VNAADYRLAAVISTGEPERLYSGLSLLVSEAAGGAACAGLVAFRALDLLLDRDLERRVQEPEATPVLAWAGRETFARSLAELRDTALSLDSLRLWACSASVETMGLSAADLEQRLEGVMSTPRFLRETEAARLLFV
jgi:peroxiredoxin family protein